MHAFQYGSEEQPGPTEPAGPPNPNHWRAEAMLISVLKCAWCSKARGFAGTLEGFGLIELLPMRLGLSKQVLTLKVSNPSGNDGF